MKDTAGAVRPPAALTHPTRKADHGIANGGRYLPYFPPINRGRIATMTSSLHRLLLIITLALGAAPLHAAPLHAADATYPTGSRVGLVPPPGVATSTNFLGFEDPDNSVAVLLVSLPVEAFADLEKSITAESLKKQGVTLESREPIALPMGKAFLVIGRQEVEKTTLRKWILVASSPLLTALVTMQIPDPAKAKYPDEAVRAALATVAVRDTVPSEEQLSLLPFKVGELAGFRIGGIVPGRAVMLTDAPVDTPGPPGTGVDPHIFVAIAPGAPQQNAERDAFARDVFATIPNLKEIKLTSAEPLRVGGQQGYQIIANAKDVGTGTAVTVVQWLRFGGGGYMQMVGIARADLWKDAYPRFRTVRDAIDPK
jgi:hypothetical protein